MFLKLKADIGENKAGAIISVADDAVGRSYVAAGLADESNQDAHIEGMVASQLSRATEKLREDMTEIVRKIGESSKSNGPPSKGMKFDDNGVPFDGTVEGTESPADRGTDGKAVQRGLGEVISLIARTGPRVPSDVRDHADKRLVETFKLERVADFHDANLSTRGQAVSRAGTESMSGGSGYGYLVKPELLAGYFEIAMEDSLIEPFVRNIPVGSTNEVLWPALDQYFIPGIGQTASAAGIRVYRKGEITQRQASDGKVRELLYKITDLTGYTQISRDLIADNYISAASVVQELFLRALSFTMDFEYINGDGVGRPTGLRQSAALLTATRTNAGKIQLEDCQAMLAKFHQSRMKSAMWIAHQSCFTELCTIKYGSGTPAFLPNASIGQDSAFTAISGGSSNDARFVTQGTLFGKPIRFTTDKLEFLGTPGDIMLVDASSYGVAMRQGVEIGVSEHFSFDTDQIAYRYKVRNDGKSLWTGPYSSTSPSGTVFKTSPFVQLSA
jgi:HK97 family phage major capsid protein